MFGESMFRAGVLLSVIDRFTGPMRGAQAASAATATAAERAAAGAATLGGQTATAAEHAAAGAAGAAGAAKKLADIGKGIRDAGARVTALGAAGAFALSRITAPARAMDESLAMLSTAMADVPIGEVSARLDSSRAAAKEWAAAHARAGEAAGELQNKFVATQYDMLSAGLDFSTAMAGTRTALTVATAAMGDQRQTAQLLATVYQNIGDKSADANVEMVRFGDQIVRTQQMFQFADLGQLSEGLKMSFSAAKMAQVPFASLLVAIGQLNSAGLQGSMAGTAFSAMLRQMDKAAAALGFTVAKTATGQVDLAGTLDQLRARVGPFESMSAETRGALQKAFGDEGLRSVAALMAKTDEFRSSLAKVEGAAGAAAEAQRRMESTAGARWARIQARFVNLMMGVGERSLPVLERLMPTLERALASLAAFVDAHPGLVATGAKIAAIGSAASLILGPVVTAGGVLVLAFDKGRKGVLLARKALVGLVAWIGGPAPKAAAASAAAAATTAAQTTAAAWTRALGKVLLLFEVFRTVGAAGRWFVGFVDEAFQKDIAGVALARAQRTLSDPAATSAQRDEAQRQLDQAGWRMARAADVRRDRLYGAGFGGGSVPELLGGGHTDAGAPRERVVVSRAGAPQVVRMPSLDAEGIGEGFALPPPGGGASPGDARGGASHMNVRDPDSRRLLERQLEVLNRLLDRPVQQHIAVSAPNSTTDDLAALARGTL